MSDDEGGLPVVLVAAAAALLGATVMVLALVATPSVTVTLPRWRWHRPWLFDVYVGGVLFAFVVYLCRYLGNRVGRWLFWSAVLAVLWPIIVVGALAVGYRTWQEEG